MLDITDFIAERGGDPEKIRQSQRRRGEPVEIVDEIIHMFEDHRKTNYSSTQIGSKINDTQKEIGKKKKAKEDAEDVLKQKEALQREKAAQEALAAEKLQALHLKAKTVGNYVHDSVPISNDEVSFSNALPGVELTRAGQQQGRKGMGAWGVSKTEKGLLVTSRGPLPFGWLWSR